jgi:hypothetical protein
MLFYIYSKWLPAKAKVAKLFLGALVSNNLINSYILTDLTKQVIKDNTHFWLLFYLYIYSTSEHLLYSLIMSE